MPEVLATSCSVSSQLCCEKPLRDLQSAGATSPTPAKRGGFFGTLTPLTAADTSLPLAGTSIAAHVHHVAWGMNATAAWIRADRKARDWKESWKITSVNEEAWTRLAGELRRQYDHLRHNPITRARRRRGFRGCAGSPCPSGVPFAGCAAEDRPASPPLSGATLISMNATKAHVVRSTPCARGCPGLITTGSADRT